MTSVQTAKVVAHTIQVVKYRFCLIFQCDHILSHVEASDWEYDFIFDFFLLADLGVCQVEETAATALTGLESL